MAFRVDAHALSVSSAKAPTAKTCRRRTPISNGCARFVDAYAPGTMLLSEANQWPEDVRPYFRRLGDEFHMNFHFPLMPRIFMALARADRTPIDEILARTPATAGALPVGHLSPLPRRTDARDGDTGRARVHVELLRAGAADAAEPGHPPPPGAAAG